MEPKTAPPFCQRCGKEVKQGRKYCNECRHEVKLESNREYKYKKANKESAKSKMRYEAKKAAGICPACNKPTDGMVYCPECRKKKRKQNNSDYHYFKEMGICPLCQTRKILDGKASCEICRAYKAGVALKRREENLLAIRKRDDELKRRQYETRKKLHVCTVCGKVTVDDGYHTCIRCRIKNRIAKKRWKDKKRRSPDNLREVWKNDESVCAFCGQPVVKGKRVCQKHYDMIMTKVYPHLEAYRQRRNKETEDRMNGLK